MFLSEKEKSEDPNYVHLKMLSFAYQPCYLGLPVDNIYGIVIEYTSEHLNSEKKFLACYDSGFSAYYSTHHGGNINGKEFTEYNEFTHLASFEHFIASTNDMFPDPFIAKRSKQLLRNSADYIIHTTAGDNILEDKAIKIWILTHSGVVSGGANFFEIKNKSSVWTKLYKEAVSICKDLEMFGRDKSILSKASSF
jgi:hypothetical protein